MTELSPRQDNPEINNLREPFRELARKALEFGLHDEVNRLTTSLTQFDEHRASPDRPDLLGNDTSQTHDLFNNPIVPNTVPTLHNTGSASSKRGGLFNRT
jgi:hypothetical protein